MIAQIASEMLAKVNTQLLTALRNLSAGLCGIRICRVKRFHLQSLWQEPSVTDRDSREAQNG
jgi:hypothetical protein